jgi:hypothetical protein
MSLAFDDGLAFGCLPHRMLLFHMSGLRMVAPTPGGVGQTSPRSSHMPASAALRTRYNAKWAAKYDVGLTVHLIETTMSKSAVI